MKATLLKYIKHIESFKEERIQSVLSKPESPLVCLMPSSAIEAADSTVSEFFTHGTINKDSPTACDKVTLNSTWNIPRMQTAVSPQMSILPCV